MFPINITQVIEQLNRHMLVESANVEFKVFRTSVNLDVITRTMVAMTNAGGGVIIIGVSDMGRADYKIHGLPNGIKKQLEVDLPSYIEKRTKNIDKWTFEIGVFDGKLIASIFIPPSARGMCFIHSETDITNRTYYYRTGDRDISVRAQYKTVYKYMNLDAAIASLETKKWRFCEPTQWHDRFESRFYCADYSKVHHASGGEQKVFATCVTRTQNSEAAWKVYAGKEGIQSHCIQMEIDLAELLLQLFASGYRIFERKMEYWDENKILHLHESANINHAQYFANFNFHQFLDLLALKRDAYTYENEVRYFAVPQIPENRNIDKKAGHVELNMDWCKVIKKIRVDKKCSMSELVALRHSCWSCGINPVIKGVSLPGDIISNADSMKQVDVTLFNIDDMPGKKHIVIEP